MSGADIIADLIYEGREVPTVRINSDVIGRAIHEAKKVGGPWGPPCGYPKPGKEDSYRLADWVQIEYDTDPMGTYDCLCRSMAVQVSELIERHYGAR